MLKSILKRIFYMLIVVWVVSVMAFILMRCAPGDPTATMLPDTASEEQRAALYEQLGLNQPYIIQYLRQHRTNAKIHIVGKPFSKKQ